MADKNLEIVISSVNKAKAQMDEAVKQLNQMSDGMKKVKASSDSQTASIFKGVAVYDLFKTSLREATSFIKESIQESIEASRIMGQVATNVKNAGFSYDELAPKIEEAGKKAIQLGFDDEASAQSLSKLLLVTKNYTQAQALSNLAMDLARAKNISLDDATRAVTLVTQGNTKELKLLGIELSDTASTADNLITMQNLLKDSALNFSKTTAGQLASLNEKWANMKQEVGDKLTPALLVLFEEMQKALPIIESILVSIADTITNLTVKINELSASANFDQFNKDIEKTSTNFAKWKRVVDDAKKSGTELDKTLKANALAYADSSDKVAFLTLKHKLYSDFLGDSVTKAVGAKKALQSMGEQFDINGDQVKQAKNKLVEIGVELNNNKIIVDTNKSAYEKFTAGVKDATVATKDNTAVLGTVKTNSNSASESLGNLRDEYKKMSESAIADLIDLDDKHKESSTNIANSISKIKKSIEDLNASYNATKASDTKGVAEAIVASELKVADIQKQISEARTSEERARLQKELEEEQKNLASSVEFQNTHQTEIAEAKRRASVTDLQRTIEDYNTKALLAKKEFDDKNKALEEELALKTQEQADELALYNAKVQAIDLLTKNANIAFKKYSTERTNITKAEVDTQIAYYQRLATAISNVKSAQSTNALNNASSTISGARASGGSVQNGKTYLVGEMGAELFTPNQNGSIIPNNKLGGGITINISGNTLLDSNAGSILADQIMKVLKSNIRI